LKNKEKKELPTKKQPGEQKKSPEKNVLHATNPHKDGREKSSSGGDGPGKQPKHQEPSLEGAKGAKKGKQSAAQLSHGEPATKPIKKKIKVRKTTAQVHAKFGTQVFTSEQANFKNETRRSERKR